MVLLGVPAEQAEEAEGRAETGGSSVQIVMPVDLEALLALWAALLVALGSLAHLLV